MKHKRNIILLLTLTACMVIFCSFPVFAAELTEAEVEQAVANQGKEAVTGNIFIWFLCAIAFLKVSQKIDSFMASLGINVGNTGGNMMAELLIAGRSLASSMHLRGGGGEADTGHLLLQVQLLSVEASCQADWPELSEGRWNVAQSIRQLATQSIPASAVSCIILL